MSQKQKKIDDLNFESTNSESQNISQKSNLESVPVPPNLQMTPEFIKKVTNIFRINKSTVNRSLEENHYLDNIESGDPSRIIPPKKISQSNSNPNMKIVNVQVPKTWTPPIPELELSMGEEDKKDVDFLNHSQTQSSIGAVTKSAATISENHTLQGRISKSDLSEKGHSFDTTGFEIGSLKLNPIPSTYKKNENDYSVSDSAIANSTSLTNIDSQTLTNIKLDLYNSGFIENKNSGTKSKLTNILIKVKEKFVPIMGNTKVPILHNLDNTYVPQSGEDTVQIALPRIQKWKKRIILISLVLLVVTGAVFYSKILHFFINGFAVEEKIENYNEPIENNLELDKSLPVSKDITDQAENNVGSSLEENVNPDSTSNIVNSVAIPPTIVTASEATNEKPLEQNAIAAASENSNDDVTMMKDDGQHPANKMGNMESNSKVTTAITNSETQESPALKPRLNSGKTVKVNYKKLGRGLVYSCKKKNWSCVDKDNFVNCKTLANNGNKSCKTMGVYKTINECKIVKNRNSIDKNLKNICQ